MRVLYLSADRGIPVDGSKGASVHVRQTIEALRREGVEVTLATVRHPAATPRGWDDVRLILPSGPSRRSPDWGGAGGEIFGLALAHRLAEAVLDAGLPFDAIYERYSLWSLAGLALAERCGVPWLIEVNAPLIEEQARYRSLSLEPLARAVERQVFTGADAVLCVSRALADRAATIRGDRGGVAALPNHVDLDRFHPAPGSADVGPRFGFAGSLKAWHGLDLLIEAFSQVTRLLPGSSLVLIGDGPMRSSLERRIEELGLVERVRFTGAVAHELVPARLAELDVAIAPYPRLDEFYFSPLKLGEYLACGLPVITSSGGDLIDALIGEDAAHVVPAGDITALANAMHALGRDAVRRCELGRRARSFAERHLSLAKSTRELILRMERLIDRRKAPVEGVG